MTEAICKWIPLIENEWPGEWMEVEPLIRCKDCKHWQKSSINYNEYVCYWGGYVKQEDDYCSWGKRKEE